MIPSTHEDLIVSGAPAGSASDRASTFAATWRPWCVPAALMLVLLAAALGMTGIWQLVNSQWTGVVLYQHGYAVLAMSLWLLWHSLRESPPASVRPSAGFGIALVAVLAGLTLLELLYMNVPRVFLIPPLLVACAGFVFGRDVALRALWPSLILYGALPVWTPLTGTLQLITTAVVSAALRVSDVPAFIEGNFVHLSAGTFEVAEDCSGLRYLVVALTLFAFYAFAFLSRPRTRLLLIVAAVVTAMVCNWVRVYTIVLAGHLTDMQHYLVQVDHTVFGWVLFAAFLVPLAVLARRLEEPAPRQRKSMPAVVRSAGVMSAAAVAAVLLPVPEIVARVAVDAEGQAAAAADSAVSAREDFPWRPVFRGAIETHSVFADRDPIVEVYRASFPRQDAEHRLVAYGHSFVPEDWQAARTQTFRATLGAVPLELVEHEGYVQGSLRLIWAWYWVAGEGATGTIEAKLLELKGLLSGRRDAAAVALSAACDVDCAAAKASLAAFIREEPEILAPVLTVPAARLGQ